MNKEDILNEKILNLTMMIKESYPELSKYIEEMPITIPNIDKPEINLRNLETYYNSLQSLVDNYKLSKNMYLTQKKSPLSMLFILVIVCEMVGIVSSLLTSPVNNVWYSQLVKPSWQPPAYLFGPVWVVLYFLMGISLWLVWKNKSGEIYKGNTYFIFAVQLFLNFMWSIIFFKTESPFYALFDIIILLFTIGLTMKCFSAYSKLAAWLLVPYISWVSFATVLNYTIWNLNR
jgi:translocator protein